MVAQADAGLVTLVAACALRDRPCRIDCQHRCREVSNKSLKLHKNWEKRGVVLDTVPADAKWCMAYVEDSESPLPPLSPVISSQRRKRVALDIPGGSWHSKLPGERWQKRPVG
jgi:hypothetical protein